MEDRILEEALVLRLGPRDLREVGQVLSLVFWTALGAWYPGAHAADGAQAPAAARQPAVEEERPRRHEWGRDADRVVALAAAGHHERQYDVLGKGARLFPDGLDRTVLTLTRHEVFDSGIVILEYGPVAPAPSRTT